MFVFGILATVRSFDVGPNAVILKRPSVHRLPNLDYGVVQSLPAANEDARPAAVSGHSLTLRISYSSELRLRIVHTSSTVRGQIYIPAVNWLRM